MKEVFIAIGIFFLLWGVKRFLCYIKGNKQGNHYNTLPPYNYKVTYGYDRPEPTTEAPGKRIKGKNY